MAVLTSSVSLFGRKSLLFALMASITVMLLCLGCDTGESSMTPDLEGTVEASVNVLLFQSIG